MSLRSLQVMLLTAQRNSSPQETCQQKGFPSKKDGHLTRNSTSQQETEKLKEYAAFTKGRDSCAGSHTPITQVRSFIQCGSIRAVSPTISAGDGSAPKPIACITSNTNVNLINGARAKDSSETRKEYLTDQKNHHHHLQKIQKWTDLLQSRPHHLRRKHWKKDGECMEKLLEQRDGWRRLYEF